MSGSKATTTSRGLGMFPEIALVWSLLLLLILPSSSSVPLIPPTPSSSSQLGVARAASSPSPVSSSTSGVDPTSCDGTAYKYVEVAELSHVLERARAQVIKVRAGSNYPVSRVDGSLLLPPVSGSSAWRRGSFNPFEVAYPASTIKLMYLASTMEWCHSLGKGPDCLEAHVHPMISVSDNFQTGVIVDIVTGALNYNTTVDDSTLEKWLYARNYTARYLERHNLLANQLVISKTYPSNTGQYAWGAEWMAIKKYGKNAMNSRCPLTLLHELYTGKQQPQANAYVRGLLRHQPWLDETSFGFGLPPGSIIHNKIGVAYDTVEDVAHVVLPNGREFYLSAYSNGYEPNQPSPYDISVLGLYIETVINEVEELSAGLPPKIVLDTQDRSFGTAGSGWSRTNAGYGIFGDSYFILPRGSQGSAWWNVSFAEGGMYEVCVWYPQNSMYTPNAVVTVNHQHGTDTTTISQQHWGGRWIKLGDYNFAEGYSQQTIRFSTHSASASLVVNAIKLTKWPQCNGVVGAVCP